MAGRTNAGVVNYILNPVAIFPKNSITVDIFGNVFYRDYDFGAGDDTGVYWNNEKEYSKETMLFFAISMEKSLLGKFSFGKKLRSSQSLNFKIQLPIKNGEIDFEFMECFIAELEAERIVELEAYLSATGLKDYTLTVEEEQVQATLRISANQAQNLVLLDPDVRQWFQSQGDQYKILVNKVLRQYIESNQTQHPT